MYVLNLTYQKRALKVFWKTMKVQNIEKNWLLTYIFPSCSLMIVSSRSSTSAFLFLFLKSQSLLMRIRVFNSTSICVNQLYSFFVEVPCVKYCLLGGIHFLPCIPGRVFFSANQKMFCTPLGGMKICFPARTTPKGNVS